MDRARRVGVELHLGDAAVAVEDQPQIEVLLLGNGQIRVVVEHRDVRAGFDVFGDHLVKRHVKDRVAAGQNHVLLRIAAHVAEAGANRVHTAAVEAGVFLSHERRQHKQALAFSMQVPFLAGAEVVHQRMIVLLRNQADTGDARVDEIR
ncbi:hypothetical protein SDC9_157717 [bioreactor metagenome]|uniref:Uncharacterized protein n=1 Tax=bioreactor metagenome TaxID=1076179 RepID=A0A645FA32_9ZZZZ